MKDTRTLLQAIWDKKHIGFPALAVEESSCYSLSGNADKSMGSELECAITYYHSLNRERGDNIPAVNATLGTYIFPSAFGAKIKTFGDGHKYVAEPLIRSIEDVDKVRRLPLEESYLGKQLDLLRRIVKGTDGKVPVRMPDIQNPLGVAEMMWDSNDFYVSLYDHPEKVHALLRMICETILDFVRRVKNEVPQLVPVSWPWVWAPEGGVHISDDTMSMVSPDMYEEYGVRYNNYLSREFGGVYLHSCTMKEQYFNSIMKNEGLRSVNFAAQYSSDMEIIFNYFSGKAVIIPHYVYTDNPQIGDIGYFIGKVASAFRPDSDSIIYIAARPDGMPQDDVFQKYELCFGEKRRSWI